MSQITARTFKADAAYGNGIADATDHLQSLIEEAQNVRGVVVLPPGTNYIVDGLETRDSFDQPSVVAEGGRGAATITASGAGTILKMNGGSGQLCGARIENILFIGDGAQALELSGVGGVNMGNLEFDDGLAGGVLFHNEDANEFTEFNVIRRSRFSEGCTTHIEYRRGSGNDSFHGSGYEDCVFVQDASDTDPKIIAGSGCKVYNAPWSGHFFVNANGVPLINVNDAASVYGSMNVETGGDGEWETPIVDPSGETVFYAGDVLTLTPGVSLGNLIQVSRGQFNPDGSYSWVPKPTQTAFPLTTGTNSTVSLVAGMHLVSSRITASNYEFWFTHYVAINPFSGDQLVLSEWGNPWSLNDAAYGEPTFDVTSYTFEIINAGFPASGVVAYIGVTQLAAFPGYSLL